jgi:hypothetical protein
MPHDDSQFESYLRKFRPISPEKLVFKHSPKTARRPRLWLLWGCAAAAILIAVSSILRLRTTRPTEDRLTYNETQRYTPPLTAGRANAELNEAPSTKEALDRMAFPPQSQLATGEQSALSVLGKEKIKL